MPKRSEIISLPRVLRAVAVGSVIIAALTLAFAL
jgi:hypothetical protein